MLTLIIIVLALCIISILFQEFTTGLVLAGLLALVLHLVSRLKELERRLSQGFTQPAEPASPGMSVAEEQLATGWEISPSAPERPVAAAPPPDEPAQVYRRSAAAGETVAQTVAAFTRAAEPEIPPEPAVPGLIEKSIAAAWSWITGVNVFVGVGIIIVFWGMTYLIHYAIDENIIPIELRLIAVAATAVGLLYWGWRQRALRPNFALVVQGGGIGLLYLTIFAAFSLYRVMPSLPAFVLLFLTVMLAAVLAVLQNARSLALFASIGGFLAPVLTSSGSNNYIGLFSYYTVLNLGIFAIAWFKSWRLLNFVGFVFTFAISTVWGALSYEQAFFATTEPFLVIFFLLYTAIAILFATRRTPHFKDYIDSTLIFGTPLLAFGLQCAMVNDYEYGIAISAAVLGVFYMALTGVIWKRYGERLRLLSETMLSLSVIFLTLAIPFAIDGALTGATWAIEGAGILWVSIKQEQKYRRLFGEALVLAAGVVLAWELVNPVSGPDSLFAYPFFNSGFIGCVLIAISASACSWLLSRPVAGKLAIENTVEYLLLGYGLAVLLGGLEYQVHDFELYAEHGSLLATLTGVCVLGYTLAGNGLKWRRAHRVAVLFIVPLMIAAILCYARQPQLAAHHGYIVWPLSLLIYFYGLKCASGTVRNGIFMAAHVCVAVTLVALLFWEGIWQLLLCYSLLAVVFNEAGEKLKWPQLKVLALGFLPVLALVGIAAIVVDNDLVRLSSIDSGIDWTFPPGYALWPFGFVVYFYLLYRNPEIFGFRTSALHYACAGLIACLLLWLGVWPLLLGVSVLGALCCFLWRLLAWPEMRKTALAMLPLMLLIVLRKLGSDNFDPFDLQASNIDWQPGVELGYGLWPLALVALFWSYRQFDRSGESAPPLLHGWSVLFTAWLVTWEASWHLLDYVAFMNAWHLALLPLTTLLAMRLIMLPPCWPFTVHGEDYRRFALAPLAWVLIGWSLLQLLSSGSSLPLPWLPLLNPVDLVQAVIVMVCLFWFGRIFPVDKTSPSRQSMRLALMAFVFGWANADLLRAVHHWAAIEWALPAIVEADISQTVLSLFWGLSGLGATLYASRRQQRSLWMIGAALLAVVVLKLFLIDRSAQDTIERIVSFTGVGLLLVMVGYFSPLPPRQARAEGI
jgi:uncharacterized membrane protein